MRGLALSDPLGGEIPTPSQIRWPPFRIMRIGGEDMDPPFI
jgi:hypothetical protein